ncbi:radical SAM protein [Candidatus Woesearchaeota archaeon]|nr:radical SAM protein [Candidatus Woesearchaeota archaeon]
MDAYIREVLSDGDSAVVRLSGCDYRCRFCNVPDLVEFQTGEQRELREVMAEITALAPNAVVFTGGEPLLQRQALLELLKQCKAKGYRTIVDTNASKPDVIKSLLAESLVDEFRVDVKAPLASFDKVTKAATFFKPAEALFMEFTESLTLLKSNQKNLTCSFKTVVTPSLIYKKEEFLELGKLLDGFQGEWLLVPFNPEVTLDPSLQGVAPPTARFLDTLVGFIKKEYPKLDVKA